MRHTTWFSLHEKDSAGGGGRAEGERGSEAEIVGAASPETARRCVPNTDKMPLNHNHVPFTPDASSVA